MKLTVDEYSKEFKMSREMIKSKLKKKEISYIIEDGITYLIAPKKAQTQSKQTLQNPQPQTQQQTSTSIVAPKTTVATVLALYQRENRQLKDKIIQLEAKIDKLIDDKEQMLRDERDKIEEVYSKKDEQLKTILELINTKLISEHSSEQPPTIHEAQPYPSIQRVQEEPEEVSQIIELKEYLKTLDLKSHQRKIIKNRFLSVYNSDIRIIKQNGRLYLDFSKYDYTDLLDY